MIGAGGFARSTLLPALKKVDGVKLTGISTAGGLSAKAVGKQYRFAYCTSDNEEITVPLFDFQSDLQHRTAYTLTVSQAL